MSIVVLERLAVVTSSSRPPTADQLGFERSRFASDFDAGEMNKHILRGES